MRNAVVIASFLLTVSCATSLTPGGQEVRVTREASEVEQCESLGFVEAEPPFATPSDAMNEMKNKTSILGGDVLFVTNYSIKATGVAYRCSPAP